MMRAFTSNTTESRALYSTLSSKGLGLGGITFVSGGKLGLGVFVDEDESEETTGNTPGAKVESVLPPREAAGAEVGTGLESRGVRQLTIPKQRTVNKITLKNCRLLNTWP